MVPPATHRTILVVDVEKFGAHSRTDAQRVTIHGGLQEILRDACLAAGITWDSCHCEDRGDGTMVLAPADIPKVKFSDLLPGRLAWALRRYNQVHRPGERIRLRMALHAGEVTLDGIGAVSSAVNHAFRILEAAPFKDMLRNSPGGVLALIASEWFYSEVIRNSPESRPRAYSPILAEIKETTTLAWVAMVGPNGPLSPPAPRESWRIRLQDPDGGNRGPGILIGGRYVLTSACTAAKALRLPSPDVTAPSGQVFLDVPARPETEPRCAEIIFWRPASAGGQLAGPRAKGSSAAYPDGTSLGPAGSSRATLGVAGFSLVGPAIRGVEEPPFRFDLGRNARIVRLRACDSRGGARDKSVLWARLPARGADIRGGISLSQLTSDAPDITMRYHGSDVVDQQTGEILGMVGPDGLERSEGRGWLTLIGEIADEWPLLRRITMPTRSADLHKLLSHQANPAEILQLVDKSLAVPALANARSRHLIVSELPVEVALAMPRSSTARADLTALLWTCAQVPGALDELADMIRDTSLGRKNADDLANDLERLRA